GRLMRIDASATAITWLPFDALERMHVVPLELAVAHYDEPPPEVVPDLDELRRRDAFREANELSAWIEIDGGMIVDYGQSGRSLIGQGPELEVRQVSFAAVEFLFVVLDGVFDVEVDGEGGAQVGSGAILGERAVLGDGRRTATLRAARSSRVASIGPDEISRPDLAEISASRTR